MNWWKKITKSSDSNFESISSNATDRDWKLIEKVVTGAFEEQKKARRWGIFFKLLTFAYIFLLLFMIRPGAFEDDDFKGGEGHTALVDVHGMIAENQEANANAIAGALRKAFKNEKSKAIILSINSPGGSPVQSGYVYDEIKRLRLKYPDKKVYAVISDLGASGAYYIAAAADEIYANQSSLVGSIGVTASTFGFVDTIEKLGIERRHFTSGEHKAFLDPFSPVKESEVQFWQTVLNQTHEQFINAVKEGRGDRLKFQEHSNMFSGLIWSGEQALEMGLVDALGSAGFVAREIIGEEKIRNYTIKPSPFDELVKQLGVSVGEGIANRLESSNSIPAIR